MDSFLIPELPQGYSVSTSSGISSVPVQLVTDWRLVAIGVVGLAIVIGVILMMKRRRASKLDKEIAGMEAFIPVR